MLLLSSLCGFFLLCRLPFLGILSLLRIVVPLATGSSSCLPSLISLAASSISLFLPLVFLLEFFGWSSGPSVAFCGLFVLCCLVGSSPGGPFSHVSGFSSSCLGVLGGLPRVFFSSLVASLSSLSGPLAMSGYPVCPLPRSFLSGFGGFVCLLCAVLLLSPVPVSRLSRSSCLCLSSSSLSLSVSSRSFHSLSRPFCAVPRGIFSYTASSSSSALSSSSVP